MSVTYRYSVAKYTIKSDQFLTIIPKNLFATWMYPDDCRICFLPSYKFWMSYVRLKIRSSLTDRPPRGVGGGSRSMLPVPAIPGRFMTLGVFKNSRMSSCRLKMQPFSFMEIFVRVWTRVHNFWLHSMRTNTWKTYVDHTVWVLQRNHKSTHLYLFTQPHCFQAKWHVNGTPIENSKIYKLHIYERRRNAKELKTNW